MGNAAENRLQSYAYLAGQVTRAGWYTGLHRLTNEITARFSERPAPIQSEGPIPPPMDLYRDLLAFLYEDARLVREGICPPLDNQDGSLFQQIDRIRRLLQDLPVTHRRRLRHDDHEVAKISGTEGLPDYFVQNFHYQTGGYLTDESARLYDIQVEILFLGAANAMRRQALKPIAEYNRGKDQRRLNLLDVACGTGRFLGQLKQVYPALSVTGLDLSAAYLREARKHLNTRRSVRMVYANAEDIPLADQSQDIVTCIFLFHELPPDVRRRVAREMARVLRPGGLLVLIDSLQLGDRPAYDGLLKTFPARFHEPYFRNYLQDDVGTLLAASGFEFSESSNALMSKVVAARKAGTSSPSLTAELDGNFD